MRKRNLSGKMSKVHKLKCTTYNLGLLPPKMRGSESRSTPSSYELESDFVPNPSPRPGGREIDLERPLFSDASAWDFTAMAASSWLAGKT